MKAKTDILAINPGSTTTKIAMFRDLELLFEETITHAVQAMVHCPCKVICRIDNENNIPINTMVNPLDSDIEKENYLLRG